MRSILDELKVEDRRLRLVGYSMLAGLLVLSAGLWWIQIISASQYKSSLRNQSIRTVRVPSIRGKILDRNGIPLAENRASFGVNLYFEELRPLFTQQYYMLKRAYLQDNPGGKVTKGVENRLESQARYEVVSNFTHTVSQSIGDPRLLDRDLFFHHYDELRSLPMPLINDLSNRQVALFAERSPAIPGLELEIQPLRHYPHGELAAHLLGHLKRDDQPSEGEEFRCRYTLPDYAGVVGLEGALDGVLRGRGGVRSILVTHDGYRSDEEVWPKPEPGQNVVLSIDVRLQAAVEEALRSPGSETRAAAIVMDVRNGDLLALASVPAFDPNLFVTGMTKEQWELLKDEELKPLYNRATKGIYPPASVFKILIGLAGMEAGVLNPDAKVFNPGFFRDEKLLGSSRSIKDEAPPGYYDFVRALKLSSNTYFIHYGLLAGVERILEMGQRFNLGKPTGIATGQELRGYFPEPGTREKKNGMPWFAGDTANLCMGQGEIAVTPLQIAVMTAALANGGKVLEPRVVLRTEPQERRYGDEAVHYAPRIVKDAKVNPKHLEVVHRAMLADVEDPDGTGRAAQVPGLKICGKTGTAQLKRGGERDWITWFVSFAPYEDPRYAVVVMVESGRSGGRTCAPLAQKIYQALLRMERDSQHELMTQKERGAHAG